MVDIPGAALDAEDREVLKHPFVGGLILFAHNYESPSQVAALIATVRALRPGLVIAVDQEGGRVQRFRQGFTRLPAARILGAGYAREPQAVRDRCRLAGWLMASELRAVGVDMSFAPVLDLERGRSSVIGDRAFAADAGAVALMGGAFAAGMQEAGMAATGKHFPGHGAVVADSHVALPQDPRPVPALEQDMRPFAQLIAQGRLGAVMTAHVRYPRFDEWPASLSARWIQGMLRQRMGFAGAVFCDDLSMAGAAMGGDAPARVRRALQAGCDMLPVCNDRAAVASVLDAWRAMPVADGRDARRVAALRVSKAAPGLSELRASARWRLARDALARLQ